MFNSLKNYFENKIKYFSNMQYQEYHYQLVFINFENGLTDEVIDHMKFYEHNRIAWTIENNKIWLIYICALIEKNELEHAKVLLKTYYSYFKDQDLHIYLPVAFLCNSIGITNENILKATKVYEVIEKNRINKVLEKYIQDKSIAIVGNGGYELGKNKGEEIDSHDIVIRFNNYPDGYESDYGTKCNIWVRNGNISLKDRIDISNYDFILWSPDFWRVKVNHDHLNILYRYACEYPDKLIAINNEIKDSIRKFSSIPKPTTGCLVLWILKQNLTDFSNVDIYGFSFPYEKQPTSGHYYDNLSNMDTTHNMLLETVFMRNLYYSNGGNNPPYSEEIKLMDINNNL